MRLFLSLGQASFGTSSSELDDHPDNYSHPLPLPTAHCPLSALAARVLSSRLLTPRHSPPILGKSRGRNNMARLAYNYNNTNPPSHVLPPDTRQPPYDSDIDSVLDDHILDTTESITMSPTAAQEHRRPSFPEAAQMYSPRTDRLMGFPFSGDAAANGAAHYFLEQDAQQFNHQDLPHPPSFGPAQWHPHNTPGTLTPTTAYDHYPATYGFKDTTFEHTHDATGATNSQFYGGLPSEPGALYQANAALSASPQSAQDWMSNSSNDHMELHSVPKHLHLSSPPFNSNPPLLRRDGIRKKNARFEIPAERTLRTIDTLINQTTDEHEIKELKQQKRLLRNRQAA